MGLPHRVLRIDRSLSASIPPHWVRGSPWIIFVELPAFTDIDAADISVSGSLMSNNCNLFFNVKNLYIRRSDFDLVISSVLGIPSLMLFGAGPCGETVRAVLGGVPVVGGGVSILLGRTRKMNNKNCKKFILLNILKPCSQ